jgi:hypothetical protein
MHIYTTIFLVTLPIYTLWTGVKMWMFEEHVTQQKLGLLELENQLGSSMQ